MEKMLAAADLVIGMGGYNTVCEILSQKTPCLIIPRENPRKEQLIRAQVLNARKLVNFIPWPSYTPDSLRKKIYSILENPKIHQDGMACFKMTGFDVMSQRLEHFRSKKE